MYKSIGITSVSPYFYRYGFMIHQFISPDRAYALWPTVNTSENPVHLKCAHGLTKPNRTNQKSRNHQFIWSDRAYASP